MQHFLSDRKIQFRDEFVPKEFHDAFITTGRPPISLIRWKMIRLDDEVREFVPRKPLRVK